MSPQTQELVATAKMLSPQERWEVVRELATTLSGDEQSWLDDEWQTTLSRRAAELDANPSLAVPWEDVERRLSERIRRHADSDVGRDKGGRGWTEGKPRSSH